MTDYQSSARRSLLIVLGSVVSALGLVACTSLTNVDEPGPVQQGSLQGVQGAATLRAGAMGALATSLSWQMMSSGLLVDEFTIAPGAAGGNFQSGDQRTLTEASSGIYPYQILSSARLNALNTIPALERYAPDPAWHIAEMYALMASVEIAFGENLCSGVPLGQIVNGAPAYGSTYTRQEMVDHALTDLDSASRYTSGSDSLASLVAVLRGRALLDNGQAAAAAQAVAGVNLSFVYPLQFDSTTQLNEIWVQVTENQALTISDREGQNGLPFVSAHDPRVPIVTVSASAGPVSSDAAVQSPAASLTLASGIEAQLIVAEADLASGDAQSWATVLNRLRATGIQPAMPALPADSTTAATASLQLAVMFRERAFWLFETGHRHGDLRRLVRQYGLSVDAVFPTGPYQGGPQTYGASVVYLPSGENYNPSYAGCANSSA